LGPVALGLMAATCYLLVRSAPGVWEGAAIVAVSLLLFGTTRLPPVVVILSAGAAGAGVNW
jgi:chromate transport protein ChrA